jgi:Cu-Zn family superoxide dismutase
LHIFQQVECVAIFHTLRGLYWPRLEEASPYRPLVSIKPWLSIFRHPDSINLTPTALFYLAKLGYCHSNDAITQGGLLMKMLHACMLISAVALTSTGYAASLTANIESDVLNPAISHGNIVLTDSLYGTLIEPNLRGLAPGPHGFHLHENPSCADYGNAAGGHFDPAHTNKHLGPYQQGHLGDLPVLWVDKDGKATTAVLAPRLKLKEFVGHSLMIHEGGDNYADTPQKLGGGGTRIACGVVGKAKDVKKAAASK